MTSNSPRPVGPQYTYTVTISPDNDDQEVMEAVVYRSAPAAVCGPAECWPVTGQGLSQVEEKLAEFGYERTSEWTCETSYNGLRLSANLDRK